MPGMVSARPTPHTPTRRALPWSSVQRQRRLQVQRHPPFSGSSASWVSGKEFKEGRQRWTSGCPGSMAVPEVANGFGQPPAITGGDMGGAIVGRGGKLSMLLHVSLLLVGVVGVAVR
eukprot:m.230203 g.230203  ORF g.230203 m.230203 type:complete len:117 (+) comp26019_c0_seq1:795-1145(+)